MITRYDVATDAVVEVTQEYFDQLENQMKYFHPLYDIKQFHEKFKLDYNGPPRYLPPDIAKFRVQFTAEELCEYVTDSDVFHQTVISAFIARAASDMQPLEKQLDALVDLVYVILGTSYLQGFDFKEAWNRVHKANMSKVRALRSQDSKRGSIYDVTKPEGWVAPDLRDLVDIKKTA